MSQRHPRPPLNPTPAHGVTVAYLTFTLWTLLFISIPLACTGPRGPSGAEGERGQDGADGQDGVNGQDGADGQDGVNGQDGLNGPDGVDGQDGIRGPEGPTGPPGPPGQTALMPDAGLPPESCPPWTPPAGLGGAVDAEVSLEAAQRWSVFRAAREQERMLEAYDPQAGLARLRIEQAWVDQGCVSTGQLIDLGRALFLRSFTLEEGLGNNLAGRPGSLAGDRPRPNMRRFQSGEFGGPDATGCYNCHWKGGLASGGDRADNSFFHGDGRNADTHDLRNPPALWGAGWAELIAQEMSATLQSRAEALIAQASSEGVIVSEDLVAQGTYFGRLSAVPNGEGGATLDTSLLEGVDADLIVKPFGWKGVFPTLRDFVLSSLQLHMNLQAEEVVAERQQGTLEHLNLGDGLNPDDPDDDGVIREMTEGQVTALVAFLATLDTPQLIVPTEGALISFEDVDFVESVNAQEYTFRWLDGASLFEEVGCASCHTPFMTVSDPKYRTRASLTGALTELNLAEVSASPRPELNDNGLYIVPVFSDFKRHDMGVELESRHIERGVPTRQYLTRRLWGLANTKPYMHTGAANLFDEAIALHGSEGSEARFAVENWNALSEADKASLRVFLTALRRAPSLRIR